MQMKRFFQLILICLPAIGGDYLTVILNGIGIGGGGGALVGGGLGYLAKRWIRVY